MANVSRHVPNNLDKPHLSAHTAGVTRHFVVNGYKAKGEGIRYEAREFASEAEAVARQDRMRAELQHDAGEVIESILYFQGSRSALDRTFARVKIIG